MSRGWARAGEFSRNPQIAFIFGDHGVIPIVDGGPETKWNGKPMHAIDVKRLTDVQVARLYLVTHHKLPPFSEMLDTVRAYGAVVGVEDIEYVNENEWLGVGEF